MSSIDHRQNSNTTEDRQKIHTNPLPVPGPMTQPDEQLPFSTDSALSGNNPQASDYQIPVAPGITRQQNASISTSNVPYPVSDPDLSPVTTQSLIGPIPSVTRELSEVQTGAISAVSQKSNTTRQPVLIRGTGKKSSSLRPPEGRRLVVHVAVTVVLALIVFSALFAVLPVGEGSHNSLFKLITGGSSGMNIINTKSNNTDMIAQQAATATAVTQDGYDPGGGQAYADVPTAPPNMGGGGSPIGDGLGGPGRFFYGQCTDWANRRYEALTSHWVPWLGNANQWAQGAYNYNWVVSSKPIVPSIIVLQAGVQGAGWYGHVAVVESINADGSVVTSDYNWAGNFAVETFVTFSPGAGVSFVYHP